MKMITMNNLNGTKVLENVERAAFERFFEEELILPAYSRTEYRKFLLSNQYSEVSKIAENCSRATIDKELLSSSKLSHKLMVVAKYADEEAYKRFLEEEGEDATPRIVIREDRKPWGTIEKEEFSTEYRVSLQRYNEYLEKNLCKGIRNRLDVLKLETERVMVYDTKWMVYVSRFLFYATLKENLEIIDRISSVTRMNIDNWLDAIVADGVNGDAAKVYMLWADGIFHLGDMDGSAHKNASYDYDVYLSNFDFFESLMIGLYKVKALLTSDETKEICKVDKRCREFANKMNGFVDYLITSDFFNDVSKRFY